MNPRCALLLFLTCLAALLMGNAPAVPQEPTSETPASQRSWRREYAEFLKLPAEVQQRIRRLDRELHEEESETTVRYLRVMQRYSEWLDRLSPEQRHYVETARSTNAKIKRIREIKERQWIATLPKADRDRIETARLLDEVRFPGLRIHSLAGAVVPTDPLTALAAPALRPKVIAGIREREQNRKLEAQLTSSADRQENFRLAVNRWHQELQRKIRDSKRGPEKEQDLAKLVDGRTKGPAVHLKTLAELSAKYNQEVPPLLRPRLWLIHQNLPAVAEGKLVQFLKTAVPEDKRQDIEERFKDPEKQEQAIAELIKLYWDYHPLELKRIREEDKRKKEKPRPVKPAPM